MIKKTITYSDLDGNDVTEDFYFHLTKAELARTELSTDGGYAGLLQRLAKSMNGADIVEQFEKIILGAYGKRGDDNKRFMKSDEISREFKETEAYSVLFMELIEDTAVAAEFITGILPAGLQEAPTPQDTVKSNVFVENPSTPSKALPYSAQELLTMSPEEFKAAQEKARTGQ